MRRRRIVTCCRAFFVKQQHAIQGDRILFRELHPDEVGETYCSWMNDPEVVQYLECRWTEYTVEDLKDWVSFVLADPDSILFSIRLKTSDQHIGNMKIGPVNRRHGFASLGLIIGEKKCWGQGYGQETINLACRYGFENMQLHKLNAGCYETNTASKKAFLDCGFSLEGANRNQYLFEDRYIDALLFGRINTETGSS